MPCTKCKKKTNVEQIIVANIDTPIIESDFKLRGILGAIQMSFGSGQFVSNANITNELALEFLRVNPNRISMFESYPTNWKALLSGDANNKEIEADVE